MATVLVSFIGKGNFDKEGRRNYRKANYKFTAEEGNPEYIAENSSLFGVSLLKRLQSSGRQVDRWLVMGTQISTWDSLLESIEQGRHDDIADIYFQVGAAIEQNHTSQPLLDDWQSALNRFAPSKIICRLVGPADGFESQEKIWQALAETIKDGDEIVLDVTNGLRHQPVIASFMVMLLRWLRGVKKVDLYYGAFELTTKENDKEVCPVLRLPLCNELLEATEAVSTLQQTGNFSTLGKWFHLNDENLDKVVFADEVNHHEKELATKLSGELSTRNFNTIQRTLSPPLLEALAWASETSLAYIYKRKAKFAFDHEQYFQAIALLWEAIVVAGCDCYGISNAGDGTQERQFIRDAHKEIKKKLDPTRQNVLDKIHFLRNGIMHGTEPDLNRAEGRAVADALKDHEKFKALYKEGEGLLDFFLGIYA